MYSGAAIALYPHQRLLRRPRGPIDGKSQRGPGHRPRHPASPDFWDQQYLFGDWGGERTELAKEGITFDFNDIGDFLTDVTGSADAPRDLLRPLPR